jgi:hypothetical protein
MLMVREVQVDEGQRCWHSPWGAHFERFIAARIRWCWPPPNGFGSFDHPQLEMHDGRILMASKGLPGEGSTFSFTLPAQKK